MFKDNPFYVLGAELSDSKRKIVQLAEEAELLYDDEPVDEAKDILLQPGTRLAAILEWLPGFDEKERNEIFKILGSFKSNKDINATLKAIDSFFEEHDGDEAITGYYYEDDEDQVNFESYAIEYVNVLLELLEEADEKEYWDMASGEASSDGEVAISKYIKHVAVCLKSLDIDDVINRINEKGNGSGFWVESGSQLVIDATTAYKNKIVKKIETFLENLPGETSAEIYRCLIADVTNRGEEYDYDLELVEKLYNNYKIGIFQYLQDEKSNIITILSRICEVLQKSGPYDKFESHMDDAYKLFTQWVLHYQPIYFFEQIANNEKSKNEILEILLLFRKTFITYYNVGGNAPIVTDGLVLLKISFLGWVDEFNSIIINDLEVIRKQGRVQEPSDTHEVADRLARNWDTMDPTYFSSTIGWLGNKVLIISEHLIAWGDKVIKTSDVTSLNWGEIRKQVLIVVPVNTEHYITIKTPNDKIQLRVRGKYYGAIVDALLKAVGYRLYGEFRDTILNGGMVNVRGAKMKNDGMLLPKFYWFEPDEFEFFSWDDINMYVSNGSMHIEAKSNKQYCERLSFMEHDNAPLFFAMLDTFYTRRKYVGDTFSDVYYREFNG